MNAVTLTPGYRSRIAEAAINTALDAVGAVVIEGPRACGKTWTARQFARSEVLFDGSDEQAMAFAVDPARTLDGAVPRLLDEQKQTGLPAQTVYRCVKELKSCGIISTNGGPAPVGWAGAAVER